MSFSNYTEVVLVDATLASNSILLPPASEIPYRLLTFKDAYGRSQVSTITVQTQGTDYFEDGTTTTAVINLNYGATTFYAGFSNRWMTLGGTVLSNSQIARLSTQTISVSSINGGQLLSFANIQSTVTGLGSAGYISSSQLISTVAGLGTGGGLTSNNLISTVAGLGTAGYISTSQLISTVAGIGSGGGGGGITSNNLTSTVAGLGTAGYVSTSAQSQYSYFTVKSGTSYSGEPWTEQIMTLSNVSVFNSPLNLEVNDTVLRVTTSNPTVMRVNYMTGGNNNTLTVPRPTITMILSTTTSETVYPSVENFEGGGGSVSFLEQFDSNSRIYFKMRGLSNYTFGTIDSTLYRMSFELLGETRVINVLSNLSSISSIIDNLYTKNTRVTTELFVDLSTISRTVETNYLRVWDQAIIGSNSVTIRNDAVNASNVQVSSLNILDQSTMRYVPLSISSGSIYLNSVLASAGGGGGGGTVAGGSTLSSLFVGSSSNQNFIKFWGSIGEYNNTAIVQQSTGGGTNEFLFFEGSSINDQFRFQTTGNIRFETGVVGPRNVNTATQLVTPTMMINSSSNVGIMTASPTFTLDVAGTARFQTLASTTSMYAGALYLGVFFG